MMSTVSPGKVTSTHFKSISTHRTSRTHELPSLHTLTKPTPNSIESTVYRNPTHTDRYLDYNSNQTTSGKLSVIHTLIHRAKQYVLHLNFLQKKWITFTNPYNTTTTQHNSFIKTNPNIKPKGSKTH